MRHHIRKRREKVKNVACLEMGYEEGNRRPGVVVVQAYNPSTQEAEAAEL
jgi:hypothetical protein